MVNYSSILSEINVSEFPLSLRLNYDGDNINVEMTVLDRTEKTGVDLRFVYAGWRTKCPRKALKYVYDCIENAVIHELREQFYFRSVRVYDPHEE
jgi:hypothetical protein